MKPEDSTPEKNERESTVTIQAAGAVILVAASLAITSNIEVIRLLGIVVLFLAIVLFVIAELKSYKKRFDK